MQRGVLNEAYRNSATFGTPTWVEMTFINDLVVNPVWGTSPANDRSSQVGSEAPALLSLSVTGTVKVMQSDTGYLALRTAFLAATPIDLMFLTGPSTTTGESGFRCEWLIKSMSQDQGTGIGQTYDSIEFVPHGLSTNVKHTVVVTAGAPVYTAI
jgi:hypothetical protein